MNNAKNKNLYAILKINKDCTSVEIKKAYYALSKKYHPDLNKGEESDSIFKEICDAYKVLINEDTRLEYDLKSKFGNKYNEYFEYFEINQEFDYSKSKDKLDNFKSKEILDIYIKVSDDFTGEVEYERWVKCKSCEGTGKDLSSKILIKDINGNIVKTFDGEDGCDFCEGTGKFMGLDCSFCHGKGKVGLNHCSTCIGEGRVLGKQKLTKIKLDTEKFTKIPSMGHSSKLEPGKSGFLFLIRD